MIDVPVLIGIIGTIIGIIGGVTAIYFSVKSNSRTLTTDSENDGREIGQILADLGYIKLTVDEIKTKVERQDQRHFDITSRLAVLESFRSMVENNFKTNDNRFKSLEDEVNKLREEVQKIK